MNIPPCVYSILFDPLLFGIRQNISKLIHKKSKVIDIACGTGALSFHLANSGHIVTGVDIDSSMIRYANKKRKESDVRNLRFIQADASGLKIFKDKEFDYSVMTLALHQFSLAIKEQVLREAIRISKKIIIADYAFPQPDNFYGKAITLIERIAGKEHFSNFKAYIEAGGIKGIAVSYRFNINFEINFGKGILTLTELW